jgi:ABC-type glycerol-3-phosphate transport system substrate-binding protein
VKPFLAAVFVIALGALVSGCAGTGSAGSSSSASGTNGGSGVTVFGTIDAGVSGTTNKSSR